MSSVSTEKSCWKDSAEEERLLRAEKAELQCTEDVSKRTRRKGRQWHVWGLCASNTVFAAISLLLAMAQYRREECSDPSITIYCRWLRNIFRQQLLIHEQLRRERRSHMSNIATKLHSRTRLPTWDSPMMRWTNAGSTSTIVSPFLCVCVHSTKKN